MSIDYWVFFFLRERNKNSYLLSEKIMNLNDFQDFVSPLSRSEELLRPNR